MTGHLHKNKKPEKANREKQKVESLLPRARSEN